MAEEGTKIVEKREELLEKTIKEVFGKIPVIFSRKPAKMGEDHIFWVPRVYLKNGLVDPTCEYEIFLRKKQK